jgi:predicted nucleic acid-binding protein
MNNLYIDTNIILDFLLNRSLFDIPATKLFDVVEHKKCNAFTSPINIIHTHYQLRKQAGEQQTRLILTEFLRLVNVVDITHLAVNQALMDKKCKDLEDALQYAICLNHPINYLITRNIKDFPTNEKLVVCDAEMYLKNAK